MKKALLFWLGVAFSLTALASENPVGEKAAYTLNDSSGRSSWIIKAGKADAKVLNFDPNNAFGPGYVLEINYDLTVRFKGRQQGTIKLLVPTEVFAANFISELAAHHPKSFGSFDLDYHGVATAKDANDRSYNDCAKTRIFNVSPEYLPSSMSNENIRFLSHEIKNFEDESGEGISAIEVENIEINLRVHQSVPVLGAVQLDVSGSSSGVSFKAGFDYKP